MRTTWSSKGGNVMLGARTTLTGSALVTGAGGASVISFDGVGAGETAFVVMTVAAGTGGAGSAGESLASAPRTGSVNKSPSTQISDIRAFIHRSFARPFWPLRSVQINIRDIASRNKT